ncbi:MAG: DUF475 domain-containing protein, partial [Acidobacteria bacterium]|nr:DUF475 domain-containing protein [Acidobacteriota bacterium]
MTLEPERQRFRLKSAVRFLEELGGAGDGAGLIGKVKDLEQIGAFGGMFLLMVFLKFILDAGKELHWIAIIDGKTFPA